jgi:hypothetical protein
MTEQREMTFGEKAVGLTFNPSGDENVNTIKQTFANAIDVMNNLRNATSSGEKKRMYALAISDAQAAQMWAVKAVTWRD